MEAMRLREVDKDYRNHLQAFLNFAVQAKKKVGKNKTRPIYSRFEKFYDYDHAIARAKQTRKPDRFTGLKQFLRKGGGDDGGKL